ncbi:MAG: hypothetical protein AAFQ66_05960 [Pseudomonadota bacterium]
MSISERFSKLPTPLIRIAIPAWRTRRVAIDVNPVESLSKRELTVLFREELNRVGSELCPKGSEDLMVLRGALGKTDTAA